MRTAIVVEDGRLQVVLHPETATDAQVFKLVERAKDIQWHVGTYYQCAGGWTRQGHEHSGKGDSIILVLDEPE